MAELHDIGVHRACIGGNLDDEPVLLLSDEAPDGARRLPDQGGDIDVLGERVHAVRLDLAEVEDVVDEAEQVTRV